jgi:hypothetical protein
MSKYTPTERIKGNVKGNTEKRKKERMNEVH